MIEILRNMWRRKARTALTITGIAVGIFAFTVMSGMAIKFNKMIDGAKKYVTGQITVSPKGSSGMESAWGGTGGQMIPLDTIEKIKEVEGVESVTANIQQMLQEKKEGEEDDASSMMSFGTPDMLIAMDMESGYHNRNWDELAIKEGRMLEGGDDDKYIVIGYNIALDRDWKVGDQVKVKDHDFEVLGIIDKTMTGPDTVIFMGIKPGRDILIESNPFLKSLKEQSEKAQSVSERELARMPKDSRDQILQAKTFKEEDVSTGAGVAWEDGADPEEVVQRLRDQFQDDITVLSPKKMGEQIDQASATFNALILGSALIALIVGGFSVINTMMMSISERTREIGIKKALGASSGSITWEYTLEAGVMGFIGGVVGVLIGWGVADVLNQNLASTGAEIFLIEPLNLAWIVLFSVVIGMVAGLLPALRAARLKIVRALKEIIS